MHLYFALAFAGGFYHPMDIASESERFQAASEALQAPVTSVQAAAQARSQALIEHELALDLLGSRAVDAEHEHHAVLRHEYQKGFGDVQAFMDLLVTDFDRSFTSAMERALTAHAGLTECAREVEQGTPLPGLPARRVANPECVAPDQNASIAQTIDEDEALQAELDALLARAWPTFSGADGPGAPLEGASKWVDLSRVATTFLQPLVKSTARSEAAEQSRLELESEQGAGDRYLTQLQALRTKTSAQRRDGAASFMLAIERAFQTDAKRSGASTAWCPRPSSLGGCVGEDVTDDWLKRIENDRKIQKTRS